MIRYALICAEAHEFEAWFRDIAAFDDQAATGALSCPYCQSTDVQKGVMAPHVARGVDRSNRSNASAAHDETRRDLAAPPDDVHRELRVKIKQLREKILASTEDVGERFPAEARKIQSGESEPRPIRGRATLGEAKALIEEGVAVLPLPGEGH